MIPLQRYGVLGDVLLQLAYGASDVMKSLRPFDAVQPSQLPVRWYASQRRRIEIQDDMFDELAVGSLVIAAKDRQAALFSRKPRSQPRAAFTGRALRDVEAIALHLPIDGAADIDDAIDELRPASEVILFAHAVWLQPCLELLDVVAA